MMCSVLSTAAAESVLSTQSASRARLQQQRATHSAIADCDCEDSIRAGARKSIKIYQDRYIPDGDGRDGVKLLKRYIKSCIPFMPRIIDSCYFYGRVCLEYLFMTCSLVPPCIVIYYIYMHYHALHETAVIIL